MFLNLTERRRLENLIKMKKNMKQVYLLTMMINRIFQKVFRDENFEVQERLFFIKRY